MMGAIASQITNVSIVCWTVCSGADQRMHQSTASLSFVRGIHPWLVDSPQKGPVTRKMCPFNDVIMRNFAQTKAYHRAVHVHQRKHQSSASLAFVRGIHRWPVDSSHKGPVTWKMFPFDDVIMRNFAQTKQLHRRPMHVHHFRGTCRSHEMSCTNFILWDINCIFRRIDLLSWTLHAFVHCKIVSCKIGYSSETQLKFRSILNCMHSTCMHIESN